EFALRRRKVVARPDPTQLTAQPGERTSPLSGRRGAGLSRLANQGLIVGGDLRSHPRGELALLTRRGEFADPDRRLTARVNDLVCEPFQLLAVARVKRERGETIEHLRGAQAAELPPQRTARG